MNLKKTNSLQEAINKSNESIYSSYDSFWDDSVSDSFRRAVLEIQDLFDSISELLSEFDKISRDAGDVFENGMEVKEDIQ